MVDTFLGGYHLLYHLFRWHTTLQGEMSPFLGGFLPKKVVFYLKRSKRWLPLFQGGFLNFKVADGFPDVGEPERECA